MSGAQAEAGAGQGQGGDAEPRALRELLLATHNEHKRREFERLLAAAEPGSIALRALPDEVELPPEDGETFADNALGKARAAARQTGAVAIADDSGICARGAGRGAGGALGALRGRARQRRGEPAEAAARGACRQPRSSTCA